MPTRTPGKTTRKRANANGKCADPLLEYRALLDEIDFSERGTQEEIAASDIAMLKATAKMRRRANAIALD